ncbi:MAG TPA: DUF948 domain-containing protein [Syntrophorhabdaceae bacterium]|nr:DUF948 domain-containing protein [Syntrophorhabdaceae bacterium]
MNILFLGILTLAAVVFTIFSANALLEFKRTLQTTRTNLTTLTNSIVPAVEELRITIESIRKIASDVGVASENVKNVSASIKDFSVNVTSVSDKVRHVVTDSAVQIAGIKSGIKAGFNYFVSKQLQNRLMP